MTGSAFLLGSFFVLCAAGLLLAGFVAERRQPLALALVASAAAVVLLAASGGVLLSGQPVELRLWPLISLGTLTLAMDRLSALFVFVVGLVFLPVSVFSATYLGKYLGEYSLRYFSLLYYGFFASLVFVLISSDAFLFVVSWEVMSVLSYLLVNYEHKREESARAGFLMIAMSEAGAIAVVVAFAIIVNASGRLDFAGMRAASALVPGAVGLAVFLLSFFGFAVKAGLVPLNSWLPQAHPVAPTNVSALLSGVMVNLGVYGILRVNGDLVPIADVGQGLVVLVVGSASALVGILYATIQTDLKRMLAHSTIENMGIVVTALGAGLVFSAAGFPVVAGIALITALYHMVNHSLYKTLLFIGSGALEAGTGSRDLDRLGGLIRNMPWTAALFLAGVWSIASLPPFNGFVSEWLTLQSMLRAAVLSSTAVKIVFALSGAALALTAGLAVTCFVKAFAMGFLGIARSAGARGASEAPAATRGPMAFLAACCFLLGVLPTFVIPVLDRTVAPIAGAAAADALVPPFFTVPAAGGDGLGRKFVAEFHDLGAQVGRGVVPGRGLVVLHRGAERNPVVFAMSTSYMLVALIVLLAAAFVVFRWLGRGRSVTRLAVWDGGLRRLRPETTYTATGFSNPVRVVFHAILRPVTVEDSTEAVAEHFRTAIRREHVEVHIFDRWALHPIVAGLSWIANGLRRLHIGPVNAYAAYVLIALLLVLALGLVRL